MDLNAKILDMRRNGAPMHAIAKYLRGIDWSVSMVRTMLQELAKDARYTPSLDHQQADAVEAMLLDIHRGRAVDDRVVSILTYEAREEELLDEIVRLENALQGEACAHTRARVELREQALRYERRIAEVAK